jgi:hypothetical protein
LRAVDARRALLGSLIDHAPLFPPASLPVAEALEEDRRARASEHSWLLARFVVPASKLAEVAEERALSVVVDGRVPDDPRVEAVEAREPVEFAGEVYVERVPLDEVASRGLRAKARCRGGRVPSIAELAAFVRGCRERGLVFKATAGLHHAYPTESGEHGFLNLLAAAVFGDEERALAAPPGSFALDADSFQWEDRRAGAAELAHARASLLHSIGSCSFFEPVEELRRLAMLP